ncbi:MAG: hypothetical protein SGI94_07655 [Saprospiraceae bacterium]|nr:hypothetical protein [Saprospiraceae bacterium]
MSSACGSLQSANIGAVTGSATYDACDSDTISISANNVPSATADKQYSVQREVCGDREVIVKVLSVSGGLAGLELRASNAPGAIKVGLRTVLGTSVQRFVRTSTDGAQSSNNTTAVGHKWLKLVRSGSSGSTYTSQNGSSWNFAATYTISLPTCVQASLLMQSVNVNTTHTGVFKDLQFSSFTAPAGDTTTVSFDQDTISADAGDTVMICVNIEHPCVCSPTEVDVELQGSGSPHLSGYSTQALIFDDTSSQKCFSLPVSGAAGSSTYTFSLENLIGGNGAEAGVPETVVLEVTGERLSFCGASFTRTEIHPDSVIAAYDRFGNIYTAYDLEGSGGSRGACAGPGFFLFDFEDIGDFTVEEQNTICEVFDDLSDIISNPLGNNVLIFIKKAALEEDVLAQGSAIYPNGCGISYPRAWEVITGPNNPLVIGQRAGILTISNLIADWNTFNEGTTPPL